MRLYLPTHRLQVVLDNPAIVNEMAIVIYYNEIDLRTNAKTPNILLSQTTNGTTPVTLVGPPTFGHEFELVECEIYNTDIVSKDVTIQITDGDIVTPIHQEFSLDINGILKYEIDNGWSSNTSWISYSTFDGQNTGVVIKSSNGKIGGWYIINNNTDVRYVKLYDKSTLPTDVDIPILRLPIPPNGGCNLISNAITGILKFVNGIGIRVVNGPTDNDNTAPTENDVTVNIFFK